LLVVSLWRQMRPEEDPDHRIVRSNGELTTLTDTQREIRLLTDLHRASVVCSQGV
jgi:hypothetical protein